MSLTTENDPRSALVREKYFSLHPKPLERWIWQQGIPQAAERVFWLHWEEGMRQGDWCSELSLRQVARECCLDTSTVTRAYQLLKRLGLIERQDPGRDPKNPFQQAIAVTEVRVPRDLLVTLGRAPNRPSPKRLQAAMTVDRASGNHEVTAPTAASPRPKLSRVELSAVMASLSTAERNAFFVASRDRRSGMAFDSDTRLSPDDQAKVLALLAQVSAGDASTAQAPSTAAARPSAPTFAKARQVTLIEAARLRRKVLSCVTPDAAEAVFAQVLWSLEEGALRRFDVQLAANIALKKIREGAWTCPNRMPAAWRHSAPLETCSAA